MHTIQLHLQLYMWKLLKSTSVSAEIVSSIFSEILFYIGLATYLRVIDNVQKPYLQFSAKRWSLITGLKGYITSAFFVMGFKIFAPLFALYVTWPSLGLPGLVAVAPYLVGCLVQYLFERFLDRNGSSSWPLVPIIFEVCKLPTFSFSFRGKRQVNMGLRISNLCRFIGYISWPDLSIFWRSWCLPWTEHLSPPSCSRKLEQWLLW